jgi:hypothetical protein
VEVHRDTCRDLERRLNACRERTRAATLEITRHRKAYERIVSDGEIVSPEDLQRLRQHRDAAWSIIRRRYVEGAHVPDEEVSAFSGTDGLPKAFEAAVRDADHAADRRFEKSEASAQLVVIGRQIGDLSDHLEGLAAEEKALADERKAIETAWTTMWTGPVVPEDPDTMIEWLRKRASILNLGAQLIAAEQQTASWEERECQARRLVLVELEAVGLPAGLFADQPLHVPLESAAAAERAHDSAGRQRRELEAAHRKATADVARKAKAVEAAEAAWEEWCGQWSAALEALQLPAASVPETAEAQLNAIEEMRGAAGRIAELRHERRHFDGGGCRACCRRGRRRCCP